MTDNNPQLKKEELSDIMSLYCCPTVLFVAKLVKNYCGATVTATTQYAARKMRSLWPNLSRKVQQQSLRNLIFGENAFKRPTKQVNLRVEEVA